MKLVDGLLSLSLEILDYVTFCSYDVVENEAHVSLHNPREISFNHYLRT
jgi:hypothetical protein